MRLIDHLRATNETVDGFAKRIGEKSNTVRKIVYGQRQPSLPLAVKIESMTGGVVAASDLLLPDESGGDSPPFPHQPHRTVSAPETSPTEIRGTSKEALTSSTGSPSLTNSSRRQRACSAASDAEKVAA